MTAPTSLPLSAVRSAMSTGQIVPRDYVEAFLRRIEESDATINAFVHVDAGRVRDAAEGPPSAGALGGIPVAIKDNIVTSDEPTSCGSRMLEGFQSPVDATVVDRLRRAGAIILGKTNLDEFAMGSSTENSAWGVTRNPIDPTRVAGGSSGGSAAAVAAGMAPVALGSETGGSVRQPAAFCGVIGLKPTYGRVSRSGLVAFASSLDQVGIFSRHVDDCAAVLSVVAGHDPADSTSADVAVDDYLEGLDGGVAGLRMGVVAEALADLTGETLADFERSVERLRAGGAIIHTISIPSIRWAIPVYYIIATAEASANLARFDGVRYGHRSTSASTLQEVYVRSRSEGFGAEVKRRIMLGTFALSSGYYDAYYGRAQSIRSMMKRDFAAAFERIDLLLTPTTPTPAFRVGEKSRDPLSMYLSDVFTAPANLVGIPAIAVPTGTSAEGLPFSLQLMGTHFSEKLLLRAASFAMLETE